MGRPRKYTDEQIVAAVRASKGMVYIAAASIGCSADTIYVRSKTSDAIATAMREERGTVVDKAELKLFDAIENGEPWAIRMALLCLAKDRGYIEKAEEKKPDTASTQAATDAQIASALAGAIGRIGKLPPEVAGGPPST